MQIKYKYIRAVGVYVINDKYTIYQDGKILDKNAESNNIPLYVKSIADLLQFERNRIKELF